MGAGKKGKKGKGKTISLNDFLGNDGSNAGSDSTTVVVPKSSWADEMDEFESEPRRPAETIVLPTAPRAALGPDISDDRIPREPPFTAYIANLSYDIDVEHVKAFFSKLRVANVRLPRDGNVDTGRVKGFGYADFEDRESLIEALTMNDQLLQNRKIKVDLATSAGGGGRDHGSGFSGYRDRGGSRYDNNRGDDDGEDRTAGDWRSGPPPPTRDDDRGGGGGGYDRRGGGYDRYDSPRDRPGGFDRDNRGYAGGGSRQDDRGYGRDDRRENRGYGFDRERREGFGGDRGFDNFERRDGYARRDGYERRDDRRDGGYERRDGYDRRDRGGGGGGGGSDRYERDGPRERPKLQLVKRTAPVDASGSDSSPARPAAAAAASSSIFGGAKPVDTSKKEREIEEKLQQKREVEKRHRKISEDGNRSVASSEDGHEVAPSRPSIFGQAKPVDTAARERQMEEKLKKMDLTKKNSDDSEVARSENGEVAKRGSSRGSNHSGGGRRSADIHSGPSDGDSDRPRSGASGRKDDRKDKRDRSPPVVKKIEDPKPPNFVGSNKYAYLPDEDEVVSGKDDSE